MQDRKLAKNRLLKDKYSCVVIRDGKTIMASYGRGIQPLFSKIVEDRSSLVDSSMADKVVGKALALLSLFGQIKSVYGYVMSDCAKLILEDQGVEVEYDKIVPYIMNKDGTDKCIMEKLVDNIDSPEEAFEKIKDFLSK